MIAHGTIGTCGLEREPAGAAARGAQGVRIADARAFGEQHEHAAGLEVDARGLERLGIGGAADHGVGAEVEQQARRCGPRRARPWP